LSGQIHDFLSKISLGDLMERRQRDRTASRPVEGLLQTLSLG
jgi:hypothetical protein